MAPFDAFLFRLTIRPRPGGSRGGNPNHATVILWLGTLLVSLAPAAALRAETHGGDPSADARAATTAVELTAPLRVERATRFTVTWNGPGKRYDSVVLFDPTAGDGSGRVLRRRLLTQGDFRNRRLTLPAPAAAGHYELRYWSADDKRVLVTRGIEVIAAECSLTAVVSVAVGQAITVEWRGPGGQYDTVQLFDPEARKQRGKILRSQRLRRGAFAEHRVTLPAPSHPGSYQLRYWNSDNKAILATRHITITPVP